MNDTDSFVVSNNAVARVMFVGIYINKQPRIKFIGGFQLFYKCLPFSKLGGRKALEFRFRLVRCGLSFDPFLR